MAVSSRSVKSNRATKNMVIKQITVYVLLELLNFIVQMYLRRLYSDVQGIDV